MRMKINKVLAIPCDELKELVARNNTYTAIAKILSVSSTGGAIRDLKRQIRKYNIDTTHIDDNWRKYISSATVKAVSFDELLVRNSKRRISDSAKRRLIREGMLNNECYLCKQEPVWFGKPLTLQIDHIDGDHYNNEIVNLRLLCANCHSQTPTHSVAKNIAKRPHNYCGCGVEIAKQSTWCVSCFSMQISPNLAHDHCERSHSYRRTPRRFDPPFTELLDSVRRLPMTAIAKQYNVSDSAVRKRCKLLGINYKVESPFSFK